MRSAESAEALSATFASDANSVEILQNDNLRGAREGDVIILGCQPRQIRDVLGVAGMKDAVRGKLLISILAGVTIPQIEEILYGSASKTELDMEDRCRTVRAMPNTACAKLESMTLIMTQTPPIPSVMSQLVTWIFSQVGQVAQISPAIMDAGTALCGSGPAFFAIMLEAIVDGAVAVGIRRQEALRMAAYTMRGTAGLVLGGEHPAVIRDNVTTPGGSTIKGCLVMEENKVRGTVANALIQATLAAKQQGQEE